MFFNEISGATLLNLVALMGVGYFVFSSQRNLKRALKKIENPNKGTSRDLLNQTEEMEKVGWLHKNISALKDHIKSSLNSTNKKPSYSLEFIPILRFSSILKEYTSEAFETLENLSDIAIHDEKLQKEFVALDRICKSCKIDLTSNASPLLLFALKRFQLAHNQSDSDCTPDSILLHVFSEFDKRHTLGGERYFEFSTVVAKLSDTFVHFLLKRKLKPFEASVLLSIMPGSRVAIHLDLLPKKRLRVIVKHLSTMVKSLNIQTVRKTLNLIDTFYSPIYGGSRPNELRSYFDSIVTNMSSENSNELLHHLKKERLSNRIIPKKVIQQNLPLLPARPSPVSISDHPISFATPRNEQHYDETNPQDTRNVFIQFAEHSNPENIAIDKN